MTRPEVAVVVPTYRRPDRMLRLLDALEAQDLPAAAVEVVVVDDASGDGSIEALRERAARSPLAVRVLEQPVNRGPGSARNAGWRAATAPVVAFTDDDCVPEPGWLAALLDAVRADPSVGVVQGRTVRPPDHPPTTRATVWREVLGPSPYFEGCNLAFPRAVLEATGGFDEQLRPAGEDTVAGWRALDHGRARAFAADAVVVHDLEERPFRWHLRMAFAEGVLVDVAARHPALRHDPAFWRPWAHRHWNAAYVLGALGTVVALRWPVALAAWGPWAWLRVPRLRHPAQLLPAVARRFVLDGACEAGMLTASLRNRILLL